MKARPSPRRTRGLVALALALVMASLLTLYVGSFVQLDDASGLGGEDGVMPLGALAGLLASGALGVALSDRTARRGLGGSFAVLDVGILAEARANDGFRFVWGRDEGELSFSWSRWTRAAPGIDGPIDA